MKGEETDNAVEGDHWSHAGSRCSKDGISGDVSIGVGLPRNHQMRRSYIPYTLFLELESPFPALVRLYEFY